MYAVIETGGKQYRVRSGQELKVEKINAPDGEVVTIDRVLLLSDDDSTVVGDPYIEGASVKAKVVETGKARKVIVFKKKPRKGFKRLRGHRQFFSRIRIEDISYGG
jgi:large subunit ribosomal protein L21